MSDTHHDLGKTDANVTITVDRSAFEPSPINPNKMVATKIIPDDHLCEIMGVSSADFLGVKDAHVVGLTPHKSEGLPTGAVMGIVAGVTDSDGVFSPIETDKTTSHVDSKGDTNIYTATFTGRNGTPSHDRINFNHSGDVKWADKNATISKKERWEGYSPADADEGFSLFTGTNVGGLSKKKAAIKHGSALHRLIDINKDNKQFNKNVGDKRVISHSDMPGEQPSEFTVIDASTATSLADGLKAALEPKGPFAGGNTTFKLIADSAVINAGTCPISTSLTLHRGDKTEPVLRGATGAGLGLASAPSTMGPGTSSLGHLVFADEKNVVKVEANGGD